MKIKTEATLYAHKNQIFDDPRMHQLTYYAPGTLKNNIPSVAQTDGIMSRLLLKASSLVLFMRLL